MSEIQSLAAPEASFDRRTVVKTAAWSVPVIAAAIAAPAAAASARTASAAFDAAGGGISYMQLDDAKKSKSGTGPTGFHIQNTPGAIAGSIVGLITITPVVAGAAPAPGVGARSFPMAVLTTSGVTTANTYEATFSYTGTVPSGGRLTFPMDFYYKGVPGSAMRDFNLDVTLTLPDKTVLNVPRTTLHLAKA